MKILVNDLCTDLLDRAMKAHGVRGRWGEVRRTPAMGRARELEMFNVERGSDVFRAMLAWIRQH